MQSGLISHPRAAMAAKRLLLGVVGLCVLAPVAVSAQIVPTWRQECDKRLKYGDLVEPLKGEIFGEQVNLYDGSISFKATDISIGLSARFNDHGGGSLSVSAGGGFGGQAIVKPPAMGGWEKEL